MSPAARSVAWLVAAATVLVALVLGAFLAWMLSDVLPPGTVISIDDERFVLPGFSHAGHWLTAVAVVLLVALLIVVLLPIVLVLALVVPVAVASLSLLLGLAVPALLLWGLYLLVRWLSLATRKPRTIAP
jgi:hypothetical protein